MEQGDAGRAERPVGREMVACALEGQPEMEMGESITGNEVCPFAKGDYGCGVVTLA